MTKKVSVIRTSRPKVPLQTAYNILILFISSYWLAHNIITKSAFIRRVTEGIKAAMRDITYNQLLNGTALLSFRRNLVSLFDMERLVKVPMRDGTQLLLKLLQSKKWEHGRPENVWDIAGDYQLTMLNKVLQRMEDYSDSWGNLCPRLSAICAFPQLRMSGILMLQGDHTIIFIATTTKYNIAHAQSSYLLSNYKLVVLCTEKLSNLLPMLSLVQTVLIFWLKKLGISTIVIKLLVIVVFSFYCS